MAKEKGFRPMPLAIKIIFAFTIFGLVTSAIMIPFFPSTGANVLGFAVTGWPAALVALLTVIIMAVLVAGFWERHDWTWKLYIAFGVYGMVSSLLYLVIGLPKTIQTTLARMPSTLPGMENMLVVSSVMGILIGVIINIIFIYFVYKHRNYFEKSAA